MCSPLKISDLTFLILTAKLSPAHKLEENMVSENSLQQRSFSFKLNSDKLRLQTGRPV